MNWPYLNNIMAALQASVFTRGNGVELDYPVFIRELVTQLGGMAESGGKLFFIGNGGSAGIASHMAVDFWRNGGIRSLSFHDPALLTCISNDFGYAQVFARSLEMFADKDDMLVAISSSGASPNILNAVQVALAKECQVVTFSGFAAANPLRGRGHWNCYIPSHEYGIVELSHNIVLHHLLEEVMADNADNP